MNGLAEVRAQEGGEHRAGGCGLGFVPALRAAPRWDRAEDIGHDERASSFRCDACHTTFTKEEGDAIRDREAERLREMLKS